MANINTELDWDTFLNGCSSYEKQQIIDNLYSDGYSPTAVNNCTFCYNHEITATSYIEGELINTLQNIWNNRLFISMNDIENLNFYAKKGDYNE